MRYFLNTIYLLLGVVVSPLLLYSAVRHGKYRQGWPQKLFGLVPNLPAADQRIWFHAVSVGEVNLLDAMFGLLAERDPKAELVISTTTKTGCELAKKKYPDKTVFYCPLDFSWAVRNTFQRVKPTMLVLVELELWPNLLTEAGRQEIPIAIVNGRLSDRSAKGYLRLGPVMRRWMSNVSVVAAQSQQCANRFVEIGVPKNRVHTVGSMKFDGAKTDRNNSQTTQLAKLFRITDDDVVFVAGSTQAPEEQMALRVFQRLFKTHPQLKLVLVPRHPERADEVASLLDDSSITWTRRSRMGSDLGDLNGRGSIEDSRVLLVDTVGELGGWWGTAQIGFVGGSMGKRGGQNMIEPSAYGVATCFGPNTKNFRAIVELLLQNDAARVVGGENALYEFTKRCLDNAELAKEQGKRAQQLVYTHRGATEKTVHLLRSLTASSVPFQQPTSESWPTSLDLPDGRPSDRRRA